MEIPNNLKELYPHWRYQIYRSNNINSPSLKIDKVVFNQISEFIIERQKIWEKKIKNKPMPYTRDPILQKYKFCNIYRELDRQTIEYHTLLKPLTKEFDLWLLNIMYCRFICNPITVKATGLLNFYNNSKAKEILLDLPSPKYGDAYIFPISSIQKSKWDTREKFFTQYLPLISKECAKIISSFNDISVVEALRLILPVFKFNLKFHWTEILIDIAYQYPELINLYKVFPIGPGSKPTMRLLNANEDSGAICFSLINNKIPEFPYLKFEGNLVALSAENWEGIGCEFRKYSNIKKGFGRKRYYNTI